ncbi:hypothetical protein BN2475_1020007 [Paraburkholderia ribeironis]|uniref:HTH-like domain-containing protein n=1 Tax=Paraburkholderia ribeironis TaxID=1247936 RepID=A0A1N7SLV0_9BURK|nr:hypothetical protein BN2475_1020007 [Paraburkholderia ribeironis]
MPACLLRREGHEVSCRRVCTLMQHMGVKALYGKPNTGRRSAQRKICAGSSAWPEVRPGQPRYVWKNARSDRISVSSGSLCWLTSHYAGTGSWKGLTAEKRKILMYRAVRTGQLPPRRDQTLSWSARCRRVPLNKTNYRGPAKSRPWALAGAAKSAVPVD